MEKSQVFTVPKSIKSSANAAIMAKRPEGGCDCHVSVPVIENEWLQKKFPNPASDKSKCTMGQIILPKLPFYVEHSTAKSSYVDDKTKAPSKTVTTETAESAISVVILDKDFPVRRTEESSTQNNLNYEAMSCDSIELHTFPEQGDTLMKTSKKGFRLNEPEEFGKSLRVFRSKVEVIPLLPPSCWKKSKAEMQKISEHNYYYDSLANSKKSSSVEVLVRKHQSGPDKDCCHHIKDQRNDDSATSQKRHYTGDSCKLRDPAERGREILNLQRVIKDTGPGSKIAQTNKTFTSTHSAGVQVPSITKSNVIMTVTTGNNAMTPNVETLLGPKDKDKDDDVSLGSAQSSASGLDFPQRESSVINRMLGRFLKKSQRREEEGSKTQLEGYQRDQGQRKSPTMQAQNKRNNSKTGKRFLVTK